MLKRLTTITVFALLAWSPAVFAQEGGPFVPASQREKEAGQMSRGLYEELKEVYDLLNKDKYAQAASASRALLDEAEEGYERAMVAQILGHALAASGEYLEAARYFKQAVRSNALPNNIHYGLMFGVARMYVTAEKYDKAVKWVRRYIKLAKEPKLVAHVLEASALAQSERYREAIDAIRYAIEHDDKEPNQTWYQLLLAMYFQIENYEQAARVQSHMIEIWPGKAQYWSQLSSIYLTLGKDQKALAVLAAAKKKNLLEGETAWIQLANLYLYREIPYYGAQVLKEGLQRGIIERNKEHLKLLGQAWYAANAMDRALEAYLAAAQLASSGELNMRAAYILVDQQNWDQAIEVLETALDKGGLEDKEGDAWVLLGMARYELGRVDAAREAFTTASRFEGNRQAAVQWLQYIKRQQSGQKASAERPDTATG